MDHKGACVQVLIGGCFFFLFVFFYGRMEKLSAFFSALGLFSLWTCEVCRPTDTSVDRRYPRKKKNEPSNSYDKVKENSLYMYRYVFGWLDCC